MLYMNDFDIAIATQRNADHPVLSRATAFLVEFRDEVNSHSDGWPYWSAPLKAARKLMELVQSDDATEDQLIAALSPIKAFYTRRGNAAGMKFPEVQS